MSAPAVSPRVYFKTWAALLLLLLLTVGAAYVDLGAMNIVLALGFAGLKAALILLFFMHIRGSSRLLHLAAVAGVLWLAIMLAMTLGDCLTRGWVPQAGMR